MPDTITLTVHPSVPAPGDFQILEIDWIYTVEVPEEVILQVGEEGDPLPDDSPGCARLIPGRTYEFPTSPANFKVWGRLKRDTGPSVDIELIPAQPISS